jgi:AraC-like DNA-binding protein
MMRGNTLQELRIARASIDATYTEAMPLAELALRAKLSPFQFQRAYKHAFLESPLEHRNRLRLAQAKSLLRSEDFNVSAVCKAVGFHSASSFSAWFFRRVGISPSVYQKYALQKRMPFEAQGAFVPACFLMLYRAENLEP